MYHWEDFPSLYLVPDIRWKSWWSLVHTICLSPAQKCCTLSECTNPEEATWAVDAIRRKELGFGGDRKFGERIYCSCIFMDTYTAFVSCFNVSAFLKIQKLYIMEQFHTISTPFLFWASPIAIVRRDNLLKGHTHKWICIHRKKYYLQHEAPHIVPGTVNPIWKNKTEPKTADAKNRNKCWKLAGHYGQ